MKKLTELTRNGAVLKGTATLFDRVDENADPPVYRSVTVDDVIELLNYVAELEDALDGVSYLRNRGRELE